MKVVIPAAGMGTRFLPATKSQPKEMLPVLDKPVIQYVVEEAVAAGGTSILIVTGRGKRAIEDHFDRSIELEHFLDSRGQNEEAARLRAVSSIAEIFITRQSTPAGLGDAILRARRFVGGEPFLILLGDTIYIAPRKPAALQCVEAFHRLGSSVIAVERVPASHVRRYGIIAGERVAKGEYRVRGLVEKPSPADAPSRLGLTGIYVLTPAIFDCLQRTPPGKNGEVQLTDALRLLIEKEPLHAIELHARRYDIGSMQDWVTTNISLALRDPRFSVEVRKFVKQETKRRA